MFGDAGAQEVRQDLGVQVVGPFAAQGAAVAVAGGQRVDRIDGPAGGAQAGRRVQRLPLGAVVPTGTGSSQP